jgi:hypothetical protein
MKMGLETGLVNIVQEITSWINEPNVISLGYFERLASMLAITPPIWHPNRFHPQFNDGLSQQYLVLVIILKTWFPETFVKQVMAPHPWKIFILFMKLRPLMKKKDPVGNAK